MRAFGRAMMRTTESNHEQGTFVLLGTPSLEAASCSLDLVVVIARCRVVMCILHCYMALGHLQMPTLYGWPMAGLPPVIR